MSFRDRVAFDPQAGTYFDGAMRYIFIKPEALMGIALALPEDQRGAVLEAMADSVFINGGKSARTYQDAGAADGEALLAVIRETAPQLGWGSWTTQVDGDVLTVTVAGSPFAMGYGPADRPVCTPILGMLRAVSPVVLGGPVEVMETACAAMGAAACTFTARRIPEGTA
ncbi:V4R domain protein (plasmid) [Paracoccaceae bacterium]|nr:V4R domain protein [Paracoccaceae bacterium]